jgi:hypothetical protein
MAGTSRKRPATDAPPASAEAEGDEPSGPSGHDPAVCGVAFCPVSMLLTATGSVQPELMEHLLAAGRELLLAAQVVINARAEGMGRRSSPIEHIEIG